MLSADHSNVVWKKCKTSFYRSFNAIFGRLGRYASAETIIQLLQSKCMPVLLYGLKACPINSSDYTSLEHPVTMAFMKVFKTNSVTVVDECQEAFVSTLFVAKLLNVKLIV